MKHILLLCLLFSACTMTAEQKAKSAATIAALTPAAIRAGNTVIAAGGDKDFLDSVATGLRANLLDIKTTSDIARVVDIWSPGSAKWAGLAASLGQAFLKAEAGGSLKTTPQIIETLAEGLQLAAASRRTP